MRVTNFVCVRVFERVYVCARFFVLICSLSLSLCRLSQLSPVHNKLRSSHRPAILTSARATSDRSSLDWPQTTTRSKDMPGFIINRILMP